VGIKPVDSAICPRSHRTIPFAVLGSLLYRPIMDTAEELTILQNEVKSLRAELESLRIELKAGRSQVKLTMRGQCRCPACGHTTIVHSTEVWDGHIRGGKWALRQNGRVFDDRRGLVQAYVCMGCGLIEWYADTSTIDTNNDQFRVIEADRSGTGGPYRGG